MHGIIALDIDGTAAPEGKSLSAAVAAALGAMAAEGWAIVFMTGRPYPSAILALQGLSFPYFLVVNNGALGLAMPGREPLWRRYLTREVIPQLMEACSREETDLVIYSGVDNGDLCYYRPDCFSVGLLNYLMSRSAQLGESWCPITSFDQMPVAEFVSVKCFGSLASLERIAKGLSLSVPINRDPYDRRSYVLHATAPFVNKGAAVSLLRENLALKWVIAAGDDFNDLTMLEAADIKVVMATAPEPLLAIADLVAPQEEIIAALSAATARPR